MFLVCLSLLFGFSLGWSVACEYYSRIADRRILRANKRCAALEAQAREREWKLIDSYLRKQSVAPLVEREQVFKLPDPEATRPRNEWDEAMRLDEIKEEMEQTQPEAAWVSAMEAQQQWPDLWKKAEQKWEAERTPLRV